MQDPLSICVFKGERLRARGTNMSKMMKKYFCKQMAREIWKCTFCTRKSTSCAAFIFLHVTSWIRIQYHGLQKFVRKHIKTKSFLLCQIIKYPFPDPIFLCAQAVVWYKTSIHKSLTFKGTLTIFFISHWFYASILEACSFLFTESLIHSAVLVCSRPSL